MPIFITVSFAAFSLFQASSALSSLSNTLDNHIAHMSTLYLLISIFLVILPSLFLGLPPLFQLELNTYLKFSYIPNRFCLFLLTLLASAYKN